MPPKRSPDGVRSWAEKDRPDGRAAVFFHPLHHASVKTGVRSDADIGPKRSQHVRLCFKQTKFAGAFLARCEVRVKRLRNLLGGTLQIFLKVIPDWLMHNFFPQKNC
jgi:hypothetical protein